LSDWNPYIRGFKAFLQLEKSLSVNSVDAYIHDVEKLTQYFEIAGIAIPPEKLNFIICRNFLYGSTGWA
jgi:integrase/recombinase XerD